MASKWLTLIRIPLFLQVIGIFVGALIPKICMNDCECCSSAQDGSRNLSNICDGKSGTTCKFGCKNGFYGRRCYHKCPDYCIICAREFGTKSFPDDYQICYKCADGFYNGTGVTNCSTTCPENCANNHCDKSTGYCFSGCKTISWTGNKCNQCATGFFGVNCEPCPTYCKNNACDGTDGKCIKGCKDKWFTGDQCDKCETGRHGQHCDEICPEHCNNNICDKLFGICTDGCQGNYVGSTCSNYNPVPGVNIAIGIASAALAVVLLSFIIVVLNVIFVRRWRNNFKLQFRGPSNSISYVNTLFHLTSEGNVDTPVNNDSIELRPQYEKLEENRNTYRHAYDQVQVEPSDQ